jgi:glutathione S-transferase
LFHDVFGLAFAPQREGGSTVSQSDEIVFYTNPMSRGRIARWMLEELGQSYRTVVLEYGTTMKAPEYLAINPMGKVPAVTHRGVTVTECAAICAWLADAFPEAGLAPAPGDPARGPYLRWMFFGAGPLEAAVTAKALGLLAPADKAGMAGYGSFEQVVDALEYAVGASGGPWLLGERFSALDVYLGSQIGWGLQFKSLPDRDAFKAYAGRLFQRPAAIRAREIDDALIAAANAER